MNKLNILAKSLIALLCITGCLSQDEASINLSDKNGNIDQEKDRNMGGLNINIGKSFIHAYSCF